MNQKQANKIARKIFALNSKDLRRLQEKYDEEEGIFDQSITDFEDLSESINVNELGKKDRSLIEKLFKDYDPNEIQEKIITYLAGGLYVRVLKMTNDLVHADDKVQDILMQIDGDLSSLSSDKLKELYKESKKQIKLLKKISRGMLSKIIVTIDKIIERADGFESKFKKDKVLGNISKLEIMEQKMNEIKYSLEDAKEVVSDYSVDQIEEKIQLLQDGMQKIKEILKGEKDKEEGIKEDSNNKSQQESENKENSNNKEESNKSQYESENKEESSSVSIDEKINVVDGDDLFDAGETIRLLNDFKENIVDGIDANIKPQININLIESVTGVQESEIKEVIQLVLHKDKDSIEQKINGTMDELISLLYNKKIKEFYDKLKEINKKTGNYFKGAAFNNIYSYFDNNKELKEMLQNAFKKYNFKGIMETITKKFEEQVNNYKPTSLRITRTSSINQIAKRITKSFFR